MFLFLDFLRNFIFGQVFTSHPPAVAPINIGFDPLYVCISIGPVYITWARWHPQPNSDAIGCMFDYLAGPYPRIDIFPSFYRPSSAVSFRGVEHYLVSHLVDRVRSKFIHPLVPLGLEFFALVGRKLSHQRCASGEFVLIQLAVECLL